MGLAAGWAKRAWTASSTVVHSAVAAAATGMSAAAAAAQRHSVGEGPGAPCAAGGLRSAAGRQQCRGWPAIVSKEGFVKIWEREEEESRERPHQTEVLGQQSGGRWFDWGGARCSFQRGRWADSGLNGIASKAASHLGREALSAPVPGSVCLRLFSAGVWAPQVVVRNDEGAADSNIRQNGIIH